MDEEINLAMSDLKELLAVYSAWSSKIKHGESGHSQYYELLDFVNFRMETVETCRTIIEQEKIADALALNRGLLENYLLLILMCRGTKYIRIGSFPKEKRAINEIVNDEKKKIGNHNLLDVDIFSLRKRQLIYTFEGLMTSDNKDVPPIPYHQFLYREFRPDVMRLRELDYFQYYEPPKEDIESEEKYQKAQKDIYNLYLSYKGVLASLSVNDLIDEHARLRIDAHYTYLGTFIHPTYDSFRELREKSNHHTFITQIGFDAPYKRSAVILALIYTILNTAGIIEEIKHKIEQAPKKHFIAAGTDEVNSILEKIYSRYNYFWYIFNEPSDYDKFTHCVNVMDEPTFDSIGRKYKNVEPSELKFTKEIYPNLQGALEGWSNKRVGRYIPPYVSRGDSQNSEVDGK